MLKIQNHLYKNTLTLYQNARSRSVSRQTDDICVNWEINIHETYISFHKEQNRKQDNRSDDDYQKVPNAQNEVKDVPPAFLGRQTIGQSGCHDCLPWHTVIFDQRIRTLKKARDLPALTWNLSILFLFSYLRRGWKLSVVV